MYSAIFEDILGNLENEEITGITHHPQNDTLYIVRSNFKSSKIVLTFLLVLFLNIDRFFFGKIPFKIFFFLDLSSLITAVLATKLDFWLLTLPLASTLVTFCISLQILLFELLIFFQ